MIRFLIAIVLCGTVAGYSLQEMQGQRLSLKAQEADREVLYLPKREALEVLSFGYRNVLSNVLWFKTINYFGKHYKSDRDYRWLQHMCLLITELNPRLEHVYTFCGTMLSWEVKNARGAYEIFSKAIEANPEYWHYYYLRGFVSMYFLEDSEGARKDFIRSSECPGAPSFVARLAASKLSLSDPISAINFLSKILETTQDPFQRSSLEDKLRQIRSKLTPEEQEALAKP